MTFCKRLFHYVHKKIYISEKIEPGISFLLPGSITLPMHFYQLSVIWIHWHISIMI